MNAVTAGGIIRDVSAGINESFPCFSSLALFFSGLQDSADNRVPTHGPSHMSKAISCLMHNAVFCAFRSWKILWFYTVKRKEMVTANSSSVSLFCQDLHMYSSAAVKLIEFQCMQTH